MPRNEADIPDDFINPPPLIGDVDISTFPMNQGQAEAQKANETRDDREFLEGELDRRQGQVDPVNMIVGRAVVPLLEERQESHVGKAEEFFTKAENAGAFPRHKPLEVKDQKDNIESAVDTIESDEFKEWLGLTTVAMAEYVNSVFGGVEDKNSRGEDIFRLVKPEDFALAIYQKPELDEGTGNFVQKNQYAVVLASNRGIDLTRQGHIPKIIKNVDGDLELLRDASGEVIYVDLEDQRREKSETPEVQREIANPPVVLKEKHKKRRRSKQTYGRNTYDYSRYRTRQKDSWQDIVGEEDDSRFVVNMPDKEGEFVLTDLRKGLTYAVVTRLAEQNPDIEEKMWLTGEDSDVSLAPQATIKKGTATLSALHGARTGLIMDPTRFRPVSIYR